MKSTWKFTEEELEWIHECLKMYTEHYDRSEVVEKLLTRLEIALKKS